MNAPMRSVDVEKETMREVSFPSGEHTLKGHLFLPSRDPSTIVILNGATGVKARFYESFAKWLASEKGVACLTYDYRHFGASSLEDIRTSKAIMSDWGVHDQEAARAFVAKTLPGLRVWVIGHSLGAMCLPFQRNLDEIDRVIAVTSGLVHVSDHPWPYQALARAFWYGPFPLATLLMGYMPGKKMRVGEDLPPGVYWQWRKWCTRREFYAGDFGRELPFPDWAGLKAPIKFVAAADDAITPPKTVWRLMQCYPSAPKTQLVLEPEAFGLQNIGHINVFAEKSKAVWEKIVS
ncbi:MAG: alpha/beta fold hydrolase [Pseudomonadota bacterium]